jgi:hypothetical protein
MLTYIRIRLRHKIMGVEMDTGMFRTTVVVENTLRPLNGRSVGIMAAKCLRFGQE